MLNYKIYCLQIKNSNKPRCIGLTKHSLNTRFIKHSNDKRRNSHKQSWKFVYEYINNNGYKNLPKYIIYLNSLLKTPNNQ